MQSIIQTTLYLTTILIPLTFTTVNSELFEFPKFILLLAATITISIAWLMDIFYFKNKSSLSVRSLTSHTSLAVLLILITQALSTLFSINPYTSFWGYYSRFHQGLLTTLCYTIIYFAALTYLDKKSVQKIIKISVATSFVISLYAILQRLGIDKDLWVQDVVNRPFSTLGQPNWLAAYLLPNLFLALYLLQNKNSKKNYVLCTMYYVLIFTALLLTKSRSGFIAFGISYLAYWLLLSRQFTYAKIKSSFFQFSIFLLLISFIIGSPYTPSLSSLINTETREHGNTKTLATGTQLENGGTESGDIRKIVWTGALDLIKKYPLLGTGPETFAYTYYWVRPLAHNNTSEWDFLYNKAHNEYLNIAATAGLIGLAAYLNFHYAVFQASLTLLPHSKKVNQKDDDLQRALYPVLGASIIGFAVTNFFGFSVIPVYLLLMLIPALPSNLVRDKSQLAIDPNYSLVFLFIIIGLIYPAKIFVADTSYAKGKAYLNLGQPTQALAPLLAASSARPGLDLYHSSLGEVYANLGQTELALKQAELTKKLNPYHLNYHKSRAKIYLTLAGLDPAYNAQAALELEDARAKAPTDPKLAYNLALVYTRLGKNSDAEKQLKEAISLKPNYESPYYALTLLYEQTNQKNLIPDLLNSAETNLATYSSALREKILAY